MSRNGSASSLPTAVEQLDAGWMSSALGHEVDRVDQVEVIWGTATKVRSRVTYAGGPPAGGPPEHLCIKGGFDEKLSQAGGLSAYALEARFFAEVAPTLSTRLPRCWYAGTDQANHQGIVIMDDLLAAGCSFGDPLTPWSPDLVAAALDCQAEWHAQTWGSRPGNGWLAVGSKPVRTVASIFFSPEYWDAHFALEETPTLPGVLSDPTEIHAAFRTLWGGDDSGPLCLAHGDAHIGNTYIDRDGRPSFIDWQGVCLGPWSYDVAYFISGAMDVEDRRSCERDLLRSYVSALAANGGPRLEDEAAWLDYRRHLLHGILWAPTPPQMQPGERVRAMAERHAAAIVDHSVLQLLGS